MDIIAMSAEVEGKKKVLIKLTPLLRKIISI